MLITIPMARFLEVNEAASMVAWVASEEVSFNTGEVFDLSGRRRIDEHVNDGSTHSPQRLGVGGAPQSKCRS